MDEVIFANYRPADKNIDAAVDNLRVHYAAIATVNQVNIAIFCSQKMIRNSTINIV